MAASMKSFRLICRNLKNLNIQQRKTFCCTRQHNVQFRTMQTVEKLPLKETYTEYEVSTEEFKHVEKLLPKDVVPNPPEQSYPTPSGWLPPNKEKTKDLPYSVERTKNHNLPVYIKRSTNRGLKITTIIKYVHGDIWQFEKDLKKDLEKSLNLENRLLTEVSEVTRRVTIKGNRVELVGKWLIEKGF